MVYSYRVNDVCLLVPEDGDWNVERTPTSGSEAIFVFSWILNNPLWLWESWVKLKLNLSNKLSNIT